MSDVEDRFWSKVAIGDGCWEWRAAKNDSGYGQFKLDGKSQQASRVAWLLTHGAIPPETPHVLHNCPDGDNRACVRPTHLWLGTNADNVADRQRKGRQAKGEVLAASKRGDLSPSRRLPHRLARGDRHGSVTHPERLVRGERHPNSKVTEDVVRRIRVLRGQGMTLREIASEVDVSFTNVGLIARRVTWAHVADEGEATP